MLMYNLPCLGKFWGHTYFRGKIGRHSDLLKLTLQSVVLMDLYINVAFMLNKFIKGHALCL